MRVTKSLLHSGKLGFKLNRLPSGAYMVKEDPTTGLTLQDESTHLHWQFSFTEHLSMDLSYETKDHLRDAIEGYATSLFEDSFRNRQGTTSTTVFPKTQEDPNFSPVIDVEHVNIECRNLSGVHRNRADYPETTPALVVVHRIAYSRSEQVIMGRLLLPVEHGLCEVVITAGEIGTGCRESAIVNDWCREAQRTLTQESLDSFIKMHDFDSEIYDDMFPSHCLSRVRAALTWLIHDSGLVVTQRVPTVKDGKILELEPLNCSFIPPPRFIQSPDPENLYSDKQRFYRVSFGSTIGVQVLVLSRWNYFFNPAKGIEGLRQVAKEGAMVIHESQDYVDISIDVEAIPKSHSWLMGGGNKKGVVFSWVDCYDRDGRHYEHVIGWIREPASGTVFLVYLTDIMGLSRRRIRDELIDTLESIHTTQHATPRRILSRSAKVSTQHRRLAQRVGRN